MWIYEKKLQYPVNIKNPDPRMAKYIISQYGGPQGELGASLRYLSQRFSMPTEMTKGVLNDIGTEELMHLEMVGTIVRQLIKGCDAKAMDTKGWGDYFLEHGNGVYPQNAAGVPWCATTISVTGDPIADLVEDLAAEQKARAVYDNILRVADDPDLIDAIRFLRQREVVHFQRFGEALESIQNQPKCKFCMNMKGNK